MVFGVASCGDSVGFIFFGQFKWSFLFGEEHFLFYFEFFSFVPAAAAAKSSGGKVFVGGDPSHGFFC